MKPIEESITGKTYRILDDQGAVHHVEAVYDSEFGSWSTAWGASGNAGTAEGAMESLALAARSFADAVLGAPTPTVLAPSCPHGWCPECSSAARAS